MSKGEAIVKALNAVFEANPLESLAAVYEKGEGLHMVTNVTGNHRVIMMAGELIRVVTKNHPECKALVEGTVIPALHQIFDALAAETEVNSKRENTLS